MSPDLSRPFTAGVKLLPFLLIILLTFPAAGKAHHISSSTSDWKLEENEATVSFQYPLADVVILVSPEHVRKGETYISIIKPVDDELRSRMTEFLNREIPSKIKLEGCAWAGPLDVEYRSEKIYVEGELSCRPGYRENLKLEDRFLVGVNRLHVALATLRVGGDRHKCLFRSGFHQCTPQTTGGGYSGKVSWKEVMGKGEVLIFHGWEQWCFLVLALLAAGGLRSFSKYLGTFLAATALGLAPLAWGGIPEPSPLKSLAPLALIYGAALVTISYAGWNRAAWAVFWLFHAALVALALAGFFSAPAAAVAGLAILAWGMISMAGGEEGKPARGFIIFCALLGVLHGFALAGGLRSYSTLGLAGVLGAIGFDPRSESSRYILMGAFLFAVAIGTRRLSFTAWKPALASVLGAVAFYWLVVRGVSLPGGGFDYSRSADALKGMIQSPELAPQVVLVALILAVVLGALHALTPGHGKTVVAAYLVGAKGRLRDAIILGITVTITHTSSVILLGVIALVASKTILPGDLTPYMGALSGLIIVLMGVFILGSRYRSWRRTGEAVGGHRHFHGLSHDERHGHPHEHHFHTHAGHDHDHEHHHEHSHDVTSGQRGVRLFDLVALGVSGGLVPCADAFVVLLIAVAVGRVALGVIIIMAFSLGMAAVLIAVGITMVKARPMFDRFGGGRWIKVYMPLTSAVLVTLIGIIITYQSLAKVFG